MEKTPAPDASATAGDNLLYVARIIESTSVDGPGLRNSLYVSGCPLRCSDCHNREFWELHSGIAMTIEEVYEALTRDFFPISILGGEPLMQYPAILRLCRKIRKTTGKSIWLWSGYALREIQTRYPDILQCIDALVDGPFIKDLARPNLKLRGSTNQRVYSISHTPKGIDIKDITP